MIMHNNTIVTPAICHKHVHHYCNVHHHVKMLTTTAIVITAEVNYVSSDQLLSSNITRIFTPKRDQEPAPHVSQLLFYTDIG